MHAVETILALLVAVATLAWLADRLRVAYPILLVVGGLALSFVPGLPTVELHPDLVFLLFLPPLLYRGARTTSWREFKANLRPIALLAVGLVLFTTVAVAVIARTLVDELTWPAAFVLGAIVSPPDAIAATAICRKLRVPKRVITILEGESLVNDAAALVAYRFAVAAVVSGIFSFWTAAGTAVVVAIGGVLVGWLAGALVTRIRSLVRDESVGAMISLLAPFIAYLPAEWLHLSGVLAVVTAGVYISRHLPKLVSSRARLRSQAVWETLDFVLNGLVFILIGLQLPQVLATLSAGRPISELVWAAMAISLTAIVVRIVWVFPGAYLPFRLSSRVRAREREPDAGAVFLVAWTGLRGVVSLAAALALPHTTASGAPFPARDFILFATFGVILVTLVLQGLTLAPLVGALNLPLDSSEEREEATARYEAAHAALARLDALVETGHATPELVERLRGPYEERIEAYARHLLEERHNQPLPRPDALEDLRRETLAAERTHVVQMRDDGLIGDDTLRRIMRELDLEEARLIAREAQ